MKSKIGKLASLLAIGALVAVGGATIDTAPAEAAGKKCFYQEFVPRSLPWYHPECINLGTQPVNPNPRCRDRWVTVCR